MLKMFLRLQLAMGVPKDQAIESAFRSCRELFSWNEISDMTSEIYLDPDRNQMVVDKMLEMSSQYVIKDYLDLNPDEDGLDEADRIMLDILESMGKF